MSAPAIKGWCPGALRPMESGDGLIVRLKLGCVVALDVAMLIAGWAREWGNGQIDLSGRANFQLRGISAETLPRLRAAMAGRGLLDDSIAAEAVRNVVSSPLAGLDPSARLDIRPSVAALERRLARDPTLHRLPAKFGFVIDDGGVPGLDGVAADIRFAASASGFDIGIGDDWFGPCPVEAVADMAATLGRAFLDLRRGPETGIRRMAELARRVGAATIAAAGGLAETTRPRTPAPPIGMLGERPLGSGAVLGIGLPYGRIAAEDLHRLAVAATEAGAGELRLTPWRAVLVPVRSSDAAHTLAVAVKSDSFIFDDADPRRRIAACPGAPACSRGTTAVRADADALAPLVAAAPGRAIVLHVSGCEKGCAHPRPAPVTLVGSEAAYNLVWNGTAAGNPTRFGLTPGEARDALGRIFESAA
jgi:precorrin-3B synthase